LHIRRGKGRKDRLVTMPHLALQTLRRYWKSHRHPTCIFPNGRTPEERRAATHSMDRGGGFGWTTITPVAGLGEILA
jgi:integrase